MKPLQRSTLAALGLLLTVSLVPLALPAAAEDKVVATVNGKPLTEFDMNQAEQEIGADIGQLPGPTKRRVLVEYLIENQIFADATETDKLDSGANFEARLKYWKRRAMREAFFDKSIMSTVTDEDAKKYYDEQVKQLKPEEEVQARHILVDSEDKAKDLAQKIKGGADFAQLAKENSKDPGSKEDGGMLGYFGRNQMVPEFEKAAFDLKKGEVSAPVKTQFGWHIIKVEDKREKQPPPFEQIKDRIKGSLVHRKAQEVAGALRAKAKIEYVDADIKKQVEEGNPHGGLQLLPQEQKK